MAWEYPPSFPGRDLFEEGRRTAEVGGGGGVVFLPVPQIPELVVEVVTLSELQVVDGSRNSGGGPVLLLTSWWTFQSATETGLLRRASDSVHHRVMDILLKTQRPNEDMT